MAERAGSDAPRTRPRQARRCVRRRTRGRSGTARARQWGDRLGRDRGQRQCQRRPAPGRPAALIAYAVDVDGLTPEDERTAVWATSVLRHHGPEPAAHLTRTKTVRRVG